MLQTGDLSKQRGSSKHKHQELGKVGDQDLRLNEECFRFGIGQIQEVACGEGKQVNGVADRLRDQIRHHSDVTTSKHTLLLGHRVQLTSTLLTSSTFKNKKRTLQILETGAQLSKASSLRLDDLDGRQHTLVEDQRSVPEEAVHHRLVVELALFGAVDVQLGEVFRCLLGAGVDAHILSQVDGELWIVRLFTAWWTDREEGIDLPKVGGVLVEEGFAETEEHGEEIQVHSAPKGGLKVGVGLCSWLVETNHMC
mmetsp:Transcript_45905/g.115606  ORF Transcript_45905/g.115606 Transcript_45905/m.115606 type:complete len:253 (-) Transcript_45905:115-873(-)